MAKDQNYDEILDQNVDEVRESVKDLENPDYQRLLELEKEGKDRKTVKEFLEPKVDSETEEDTSEEIEEEIVEEIEEETSEGLLGSYSRGSVLAVGAVLGLLIGAAFGFGASSTSSQPGVSDAEVRSTMGDLMTASGLSEDQFTFNEVSRQNGMNYVSLNITQETRNGTQARTTEFYLSPDAELLFRTQGSLGRSMVMNIEDTIQQLESRQAGNQTQG